MGGGCPLVVMLIPCRPDTSYFHDFVIGKATEVRFIRGRLKYLNEEGKEQTSCPFPSMVIIFKPYEHETKFISYDWKLFN